MFYKKLLILLTPKERRKGYFLMIMVIVMALLNAFGVASIMPFMMVLGQPEVIHTDDRLNKIFNLFEFSNPDSFLFFLGSLVFAALVVSILFKALTQLLLMRFTETCHYSLSCRLFKVYLGRPYPWFLNRHSANLGKSILSEVGQVVQNVLVPGIQLVSQSTVALFLILLLMLIDPKLVSLVAFVLGGAYVLIYVAVRNFLARIGADRVLANKQRFKAAQEALGGIKEVKVFGRERSFFNRFAEPALRFSRHQANSSIAAQMPRHVLEIFGFGGILMFTLYLFRVHGDFSQVLPVLAVYAFAGYRLLPAIQQVYTHASRLRFGLPALESLYTDMLDCPDNELLLRNEEREPIVPQVSIALQKIDFIYPEARKAVLKNIDLVIPVRSIIGLVGATGSGKTTIVDIILGLISPQNGQLLVDGRPIITNDIRAWQRSLGYVPQHIYLVDDTVTANIAFGIPPDSVDMAKVIRAATIAELHDFVVGELPEKYETMVGERGVRLSGGQRQRIGIARALYNDPHVLIFDEATSALDNQTEQIVMQAVRNMDNAKTIIIIAHRLTTVKYCDCIYIIEHGEIVGQGCYQELLESSDSFKEMAAAGNGGG